MDHFDIAIVGAGVIGLAIAQRLSETPALRNSSIVVLEQESSFGTHTSSRNSEVIHAGIYYPQDSLKASLCVRGKHLIYEHCKRYQVPCKQLGKLIVAQASECDQLEILQNRARDNGVDDLKWLDRKALQAIEPEVEASLAIFSPSSGIIDSHSFMLSLLHLAQANGVLYSPHTRVESISHPGQEFRVDCTIKPPRHEQPEPYQFMTTHLINSAGLDAVRLARQIEGLPVATIPRQTLCKGDYFSYAHNSPFSHLIYPVPEPNATGLGIHATLDLAGRVRFGPDTDYVNSRDFAVSTAKAQLFARRISDYFPAIKASDLRADYAGIRPKLSGPGEPAADFLIQDSTSHSIPGLIQLFGIESPGLTASLAIAEQIALKLKETI